VPLIRRAKETRPIPNLGKSPLIIGICGGSGSGKSTITRKIIEALPSEHAVVICHDSYYKDHPELSFEERAQLNFDHPDAIETPLLVEHLRQLRAGQPIDLPSYDFSTHRRQPDVIRIQPHPAILVEGILILENRALRDLMDIKIFVDTDADLRFMRRLKRDIKKRGRSMESVFEQYLATVRPMHMEFVEPSKRFADIIIPEGGHNEVGIDLVIQKIKSLLPV
jgi:uridine kinase